MAAPAAVVDDEAGDGESGEEALPGGQPSKCPWKET